jgi:hypothetical protein
MKSFIELFTAAREISTPLVAVRTFDPASTIQAITKSLGEELANKTPLVSWDAIHGLRHLNESGGEALTTMATEADVELAATVDLPIALGTLESADEDVIAFVHNPHLVWESDKKVIQALWNLRDGYKARGNMVVTLIGIGVDIPAELQQDTLVLEEPLPTRDELGKIIKDTFASAAQKKEYISCKNGATPKVVADGIDALIGLPTFPADQASAMCLDKKKGTLDISTLWTRKRDIVSANPGLSYHNGSETLKDMYGCESIRKFGVRFMGGKYSPTLILRQDEIEKQFAGNGSDSSGTKGNLLGEWLTWVNDRRIICSLFLGVPGSSKSFSAYCLGGEYGKPVINYSIPAMEHEHVGMSAKHQRTAHKVLDAISDGKIWLIATANSLNGLPAELISRFQVGGIFFFDAPDDEEKIGILKLKIAAYGLDPSQELPDMTNWTGRDVDNCARKAETLNCSLVEAAEYIVPLLTSHKEAMDSLRQSANGRYLSASKPGVYRSTRTRSSPRRLTRTVMSSSSRLTRMTSS